jgi:hypothetical protein
MSDVAKLAVVPIDRTGRPQPDVIDVIERLLERAHTGELQSIAFAFAAADGTTGHGSVYGERPGDYHLISTGLLCLQHDFVCDVEQSSITRSAPPEQDPVA